jgi:hypothetical protein
VVVVVVVAMVVVLAKATGRVGPGKYCLPRHRHAFVEPSFVELNGIL